MLEEEGVTGMSTAEFYVVFVGTGLADPVTTSLSGSTRSHIQLSFVFSDLPVTQCHVTLWTMHHSEACYQVLYFGPASLPSVSGIILRILSLLNQSQRDWGRGDRVETSFIFCVPLPSFVGNWSKQLPESRSADGPWNSWLSLSLMIETSCIPFGNQIRRIVLFYLYVWIQNRSYFFRKWQLCRTEPSRHRREYCFADGGGQGNCFTSCVFQGVLFSVSCSRGDRNSVKQVLPFFSLAL